MGHPQVQLSFGATQSTGRYALLCVHLLYIGESHPVRADGRLAHFGSQIADKSLIVDSVYEQFLSGAVEIKNGHYLVPVISNEPLYFVRVHGAS